MFWYHRTEKVLARVILLDDYKEVRVPPVASGVWVCLQPLLSCEHESEADLYHI